MTDATFRVGCKSRSMSSPSTSSPQTARLYWIATGLFCAVFIGSAVFGLLDLDGSRAEWTHLGYPWWTFFLLTAGKIIGVATILTNKAPRFIKDYAFAGFLFDLLLALGAHLAVPEIKALLPISVLGIWGFAVTMDNRHFPRRPY